ncbi:similar to Saccharomyces cerevisiae YLR313C SPH1 Protein involved in shmoo formation and bipolar bud site selection [Maudiozyma saulgeensis]|uniref:Similar to Saccharomyces cerevisiae YLR313C SPH1 Protein involved in shmoo formation and bipolar bud site selection n=1 Tax=Maudiozyma saulgeensis TaxID=1789683 RepID=A0A1X7R3X9_9SACH|nr:similar to Saccharomyces cerevisiae YLR313C SPH1 Protein involved in shmoo formation and bipolar bud site selection [Kazachstania saulgeensis]
MSQDQQEAHKRDIEQYYSSLKTFFDVTGVQQLNRETSPRAQKARSKLLKLSFSQFYELSTDVSDELKRRINEDQNKPDYLLPKANFHMKRNQARQKLANLSQTRFNELVDDILFEIRRRGFDSYKPLNKNQDLSLQISNDSSSIDNNEPITNNISEIVPDSNVINNINKETSSIGRDSNGSQIPATTTSIQPSLVIPKKASIDWSSSEEDEEELPVATTATNAANDVIISSTHPPSVDINDDTPFGLELKPSNISESSDLNNTLQKDNDNDEFVTPIPQNKTRNFNQNDDTIDGDLNDVSHTGTLQEKLETTFGSMNDPTINIPTPVLQPLSKNILPSELTTGKDSEPKESEPEQYMEPLPGNDTSIETPVEKDIIEQKINFDPVTMKNINLQDDDSNSMSPVAPTPISSTHRQSEFMNLNSEVRNLSIENENLKQKIAVLEMESRFKYNQNNNNNDKSNNMQLNDQNLLDSDQILKFISPQGIIPLDLITQLNDKIKFFFTVIQSPENSNSDSIGDKLFKVLGHTSSIISQILTLVDIPTFKDQVLLLKASFSHLISTVRYYSLYHALLPKIIIYAAVTELAFAACNIIEVTHIKQTDDLKLLEKKELAIDIPTSNDLNNSVSGSTSPLPINLSSRDVSTPTLASVYTNPSAIMEEDSVIGENSPVKPLKITQKVGNQSPNLVPKINTRMRQPSGSGLFSLMIDQERNHSKSPSVNSNPSNVPAVPSSLNTKTTSNDRENPKDNSQTEEDEPSTTETVPKLDQEKKFPTLEKPEPTNNTNFTENYDKNETIVESSTKSPEKEINDPSLNARGSRSSAGLALSIDNIFGSEKTNDDELIKHSEQGENHDLNSVPEVRNVSNQSLSKFVNSESDENLSKSPNALITDSDNDETFLALRKVQETKKLENDKLKLDENIKDNEVKDQTQDEKSIFPNEDVVEDKKPSTTEKNPEKVEAQTPVESASTPTFKPLKINKLESASLKRVNLNKVNLNNQSPKPTPSSTYNKEPVKETLVNTPLPVEIPKRHESRLRKPSVSSLNESPKLLAQPKIKEEFIEPIIPKPKDDTNDKPFENLANNVTVKKEPIEGKLTSITKKDSPKLPIHEEGEVEDDSSYQFIPLKSDDPNPTSLPKSESEDETESSDGSYESAESESEEDNFDVDAFDIENPDNTLSDLLLYLEHQTVDVISTIQSLLSSIKEPQSTKGSLRRESNAINQVIGQMVDATSVSMNQSRNANLKEHGSWVVQSLEDCARRMTTLCQLDKDGILKNEKSDEDYADKNFKQRLAGIAFDVAKCTKELVKTVEEASLKEEIEFLNSRIH